MKIVALAAALACVAACSPRPASEETAEVQQAGASAASEIRLERTACFHGCPEYNVTVSEDGTIRYQGLNNVAQTGVLTGTIPADSASMLFKFADDAQLDTLAGQYIHGTRGCDPYIADLPGLIVTIAGPQAGARIEGDPGCPSMPKVLTDFAAMVDRVAATERWIRK